jgi:two-component system, chemotaxis family, chemotaxis protein CheY
MTAGEADVPMRAIVVDDSRATRMILRRLLAELGFGPVLEAGDGQQALAVLAAEGPVELALVDWNMPVMDGLAFVRTLRGDSAHSGCKVVMVTTEGDADHMVAALEAGADEYAMKPFDREVISSKLAMLGLGADAAASSGSLW